MKPTKIGDKIQMSCHICLKRNVEAEVPEISKEGIGITSLPCTECRKIQGFKIKIGVKKDNKVEWYWAEKHNEEKAFGPFNSREIAIRDAKTIWEKGTAIEVGQIYRIEPERYLPNPEHILADMEEASQENFGWNDDENIGKRPGAAEALKEILLQWSREYLMNGCWVNNDPNAETVILD